MDLDEIPENERENFPTGVSEVEFATEELMQAFLYGFSYARDVDAEYGPVFQRDGKFVVRVRVGDWDDDED